MQPETALWLLSALAQASAALAGLSAVSWAFILRSTKEDWKNALEEEQIRRFIVGVPITGYLRGIPLAVRMSRATIGYLLAVFIALVTLAFVEPGAEPVHVAIPILAFIAIGVAAVASFFLVLVVRDPWSMLFGLVLPSGGGPPPARESGEVVPDKEPDEGD